MSEREYDQMRSAATTEPYRDWSVPRHLVGTYCVQEHDAHRAGWHEDFRFERDGVAVSFALPKGLPKVTDRGLGFLAIRTEDHPVPYMEWSGVIPDGAYGAGTVKLVDNGACQIIEFSATKVKVRLSGGDWNRSGVYSFMKKDARTWLCVHKIHEV